MTRTTLVRILSLGLCCVLVGTLASVLANYVLQYRIYPPDSDEAIHLVEGLMPTLDARAGHWAALGRHLYFQPWYPPLYPALLAVVFAVCDVTLATARLSSVVLWLLSFPLMALVVHSLSGKREIQGEVLTVLLAATAPVPMLVATLCMEEGLAVLLVLLFLILYIPTLKPSAERRPKAAVWAGVVLAMVFLSRVSTALFLAASLFINEVLERRYRGSGWHLGTRLVVLLGPIAVVAFLWLVHPAKTASFLEYLRVSVPRLPLLSKANLTYYSLVLADMYTAARPLAPWMFASVLVSLRQWRHGAVRLVLLLIIVTLGSLMLKRQINPRFAVSASIAVFILTGYQVSCLVQSLRVTPRWREVAVAGLVALTLLIAIQPLYRRFATLPFALQVNYETDPQTNALYAWVAEQVPPGERRIALVNGWDQVSGLTLQWYLSTDARTLPGNSNEVIVEQFDLQKPSDKAVTRFVQLLEQQRMRYVLHLEGGPVSHAGAWWAYKAAIQDRVTEVGQQTFTIRLWDEQVIGRLLRNQIAPEQVETIQTTQHYSIPIRATLFALSPADKFVLLAPYGAPVAQSDGIPADWIRPTTGWLSGERFTAPDGTGAIPLAMITVERR